MQLSKANIEDIKQQIPLRPLIDRLTQLKGHGANLNAACPFCGGRDRFYFHAAKGWGCRSCSPGYHDAIAFLMKRDGATFQEVITAYQQDAPRQGKPLTSRHDATPPQDVTPVKFPAKDLQGTLFQIVERCHRNLMEADDAVLFLEKRGIYNAIDRFMLGYSDGFSLNGVYVPRGVTFPCIVGGRVWFIKVRRIHDKPCPDCHAQSLAPGEKCACGYKYAKMIQVKSESGQQVNFPALYNAESLLQGKTALICEGEIDCITLDQEFRLPVATLGGVGNTFDVLAWGPYVAHLDRILTVFDNDTAGQKARWAVDTFGGIVTPLALSDGMKDPNELFLNRRLYAWGVKSLLTFSQQETFRTQFQNAKAHGATDALAARFAWSTASGINRIFSKAEQINGGLGGMFMNQI